MGSLFLTKNPARSWNHLGSRERHPNSYMSHIIKGMQIGVRVLKIVTFYVLPVLCSSMLYQFNRWPCEILSFVNPSKWKQLHPYY
jgi:hypothetical protein